MRNIFVLLLLIFMLGCSSKDSDIKILNAGVPGQILQDGKWVYPKDPPEGWCIVTDGRKFKFRFPSGYITREFTYGEKEEAIKGAWEMYVYLERSRKDSTVIPPLEGNWIIVPTLGCSEDK
jgi:hypothetical protein